MSSCPTEKSLSSRHGIVFLILICAALSVIHNADTTMGQRRRTRRPPAAPVSRIDYSKFLHSSPKHKAAECKSCHKIPTANWTGVRSFPDVADFPDHDACVSCHRPQFFRGASPQICSVCHIRVSPRDDARFSFRNPKSNRQFLIEFPHNKHQDVIAKVPRRRFVDRPQFVPAAFSAQDQRPVVYNNCEICHQKKEPMLFGGTPDGFAPASDTFKSSPDGHAYCFSCHWKSQKPVNDECAGCHRPSLAPVHLVTPKRISWKFRHGREQHVAECTTCHINITKSETLRGLKPDVPISSCATSSCHNNPSKNEEVLRELIALQKDRQFVCIYCHTSDVGRRDPPSSHPLNVGLTPFKREAVK